MLKDKDTVEMEVEIVRHDLPTEVVDIFKKLINSHRLYQSEIKKKDNEIKKLTSELVDSKLLIQNIRSLF